MEKILSYLIENNPNISGKPIWSEVRTMMNAKIVTLKYSGAKIKAHNEGKQSGSARGRESA